MDMNLHRFSSPLDVAVFFFAVSLLSRGLWAQSGGASVCVAPTAVEKPERCATPELCTPGPLSFKLDNQPVLPWPKAESLKIGGLDATARHRVIVYRAGKAQQSFRFKFPVNGSNDACLFLNDLYWDVELWRERDAPWCKCE
jgi:hypothetical protein